jgi:hypothetical protein
LALWIWAPIFLVINSTRKRAGGPPRTSVLAKMEAKAAKLREAADRAERAADETFVAERVREILLRKQVSRFCDSNP